MALQEIRVDWDTFNFKVWCVIGPYRHLKAYVKRRHRRVYRQAKDPEIRGLYFASKPKCGGILWIPGPPRTASALGYLAHEVSHAVMDMHRQRGMIIIPDNDEPFCYAIAHGVTQILEACK